MMRFDPFRELDRASEQLWNRTPAIPLDAVRKSQSVEVWFDLPGVDPDSIDLTVERNVLTLRAERQFRRSEGDEVIASERRQGTFTRQLFLGEMLDSGSVEASYENGVLHVRIPVAETAKPRKVQIGQTNGGARAIETESAESGAGAA
jgi:HSP20 family protein